MFGIGDQTPDSAKGLEALPSNITIGIPSSILNLTFVNLCKPLIPYLEEPETERFCERKVQGINFYEK